MTKRLILFSVLAVCLFDHCSRVYDRGRDSGSVRAAGPLEFSADFVMFQASEETVRVVAYISFPNSVLTFAVGDDGYSAAYDLTGEVNTVRGRRVAIKQSEGHVREPVGEAAPFEEQVQHEEMSFRLPSGTYSVRVMLADGNSSRQGIVRRDLDIVAFPRDRVSISSIVFAERCEGEPSSRRSVVPNPERVYGDRLTELTFYCEVYAPHGSDLEDSLKVVYEITSRRDGTRLLRADGPTLSRGDATLTATLGLEGIEEEDVVLWVRLIDDERAVEAEQSGEFHIHRPLINWGDDFELSLAQLEFVAPEEVVAKYRSIAPEERERFLRDYWNRRDPVPETEANELLLEFNKRLRYAKDFLGGMTTDRARVHVQNGPPHEITTRVVRDVFGYPRHTEIWVYLDPYREFAFIEGRLVER